MTRFLVIAGLILATAHGAFADAAAAAKCQAGLAPEARLIYDSTYPLVKPDSVIRDLVKQQTRSLVLAGKVQRATARDSAKAAGQCFRLLRQ